MTRKPTAKATGPVAVTAAEKSAARQDCERHRENLLDEALKESFPASDPPSIPDTLC